MTGTLSTSKARTNAPLRARKGKLAGLLAIGLSLCCLASPLKTVDSAKASIKLKTIDYQIHALNKLRDLKQFNCLLKLYSKESAWNPRARNGSHYGIPQGNSTWLRNQNGLVQVDWGISYIQHRYGSACVAYKHWSKYGWH
jgi:hypothetical protein